eukprot:CAMPEP_0176365546 /NCGR_PEP_ID=MMETSP0126-20121128/20557_1 /TAXON_ID=141414 ORGANISM="Strombidinopsis acuminatum, Strain SPMC142" /NCGR_SAMPLE_ID=MMETSP0126 /ASSEMBLY_ACC=CAM_ASM_000229 /LENGTH=110 /DNA_ID=CAMNT_0017722613 /DNA_START=162 /DNA_END=494 /DNA_ORIENTATION=+
MNLTDENSRNLIKAPCRPQLEPIKVSAAAAQKLFEDSDASYPHRMTTTLACSSNFIEHQQKSASNFEDSSFDTDSFISSIDQEEIESFSHDDENANAVDDLCDTKNYFTQ